MYKIAIVEDEKECQSVLVDYLNQYEKERDVAIMPRIFNDGIDIMDDYSADYDIIFLDIRMKHKDGMKTAQEIRQVDNDVIIIFITSLAQYAIEGYKVNASDFILKPVKYNQLQLTLDKALETIKKWKREKQILVVDGTAKRKISTDDIYYVEVIDHDLHFHTKHGVMVQKNTTMRAMEAELVPYNFARGNNAYTINLKYVELVKGDEVMVNGNSLYMSRGRKKDFLRALADYVGTEV
ncbi:MAG: response regulator transcription factor [Lachnospiraceae bacterium]|nr:response regulator transcription factor [Lachnospiraceae bacterium]